jgi:dolichyl-phosphate-mannose-protein mannosyltransferase
LDEAQVKALEGKVSFSTRYETRTRVVDAQGHELADGSAGAEGLAPPHPDVDREPETVADLPNSDGSAPATVSVEEDIGEGKLVEKALSGSGSPRPASEGQEPTK